MTTLMTATSVYLLASLAAIIVMFCAFSVFHWWTSKDRLRREDELRRELAKRSATAISQMNHVYDEHDPYPDRHEMPTMK